MTHDSTRANGPAGQRVLRSFLLDTPSGVGVAGSPQLALQGGPRFPTISTWMPTHVCPAWPRPPALGKSGCCTLVHHPFKASLYHSGVMAVPPDSLRGMSTCPKGDLRISQLSVSLTILLEACLWIPGHQASWQTRTLKREPLSWMSPGLPERRLPITVSRSSLWAVARWGKGRLSLRSDHTGSVRQPVPGPPPQLTDTRGDNHSLPGPSAPSHGLCGAVHRKAWRSLENGGSRAWPASGGTAHLPRGSLLDPQSHETVWAPRGYAIPFHCPCFLPHLICPPSKNIS